MEAALKSRLDAFQVITSRNTKDLYKLADLLEEVMSAKLNPALSPLFAVYDSSSGVNTIVKKLPYTLKTKWVMEAAKYKEIHLVFHEIHKM